MGSRKLYLHCGWLRTGTSSLQAALYAHRDTLAAGGVTYPDRWLGTNEPAHHGLYEMLDPRRTAGEREQKELIEFLAERSDRDLLFSTEGLTSALATVERQDAAVELLERARSLMPTRCVWALRRFDETVASLFLLRLRQGVPPPPPQQYFAEFAHTKPLFEGMARARDAVAGDVAYVGYEPSGSYWADLLAALDLPATARTALLNELTRGPRVNASVTHKQALALIHLDELSARLGVELDRTRLRNAFRYSQLVFDDDWRCEPMDVETKRAFHERALAAASESGFEVYEELFGEAEVEGPESVGWDLDALTEADLAQLAT
jgi:hypothetical protein